MSQDCLICASSIDEAHTYVAMTMNAYLSGLKTNVASMMNVSEKRRLLTWTTSPRRKVRATMLLHAILVSNLIDSDGSSKVTNSGGFSSSSSRSLTSLRVIVVDDESSHQVIKSVTDESNGESIL